MTCSRSSPSRKKPRRRSSVLRVALTGGIACGKSVVACLLADKGAVVYSADRAAHALMSPGRPAWKKIVGRFGRSILRPDRTIDRLALGAIVFADTKARRFLDRVVHPLVLADQEKALRRVEREGSSRLFVVEAALILEAGYAARFDRIAVVRCRRAEQVRRLRARDGIAQAAALRKIRAQMPQRDKLRRADYIVDASGSLSQTVEEAERLYAQLMRDADAKTGSNQFFVASRQNAHRRIRRLRQKRNEK